MRWVLVSWEGIYASESDTQIQAYPPPVQIGRLILGLKQDSTTKMSNEKVEKYDGEKDIIDGDGVAVLPPDNWVGSMAPRRFTTLTL